MTELEMFAKLPQLDEDCERTDLGYVPTLSVIDNSNFREILDTIYKD